MSVDRERRAGRWREARGGARAGGTGSGPTGPGGQRSRTAATAASGIAATSGAGESRRTLEASGEAGLKVLRGPGDGAAAGFGDTQRLGRGYQRRAHGGRPAGCDLFRLVRIEGVVLNRDHGAVRGGVTVRLDPAVIVRERLMILVRVGAAVEIRRAADVG